MVMKRFYSELGKLLYALSYTDSEISEVEKQKIFDSVRKDLLPKEEHNDLYGENLVSYVFAEFDFLEEQMAEAKASYESFIDYIREHQTAISQNLKTIILETARKVAVSGNGKREEERKLFNNLRSVLATIRPLKRPRKVMPPVRITAEETKKHRIAQSAKTKTVKK
jgi:hypothetical protein